MSVVNKMLQDLESRKQHPSDSANFRPPEKKRYGWWLLGVLPLALILAIIYWLWPVIWDAGEPEPPSGPLTQTVPLQSAQPAEKGGAAAKPEKKHDSSIAETASEAQPSPQQQMAASATDADADTGQKPGPRPVDTKDTDAAKDQQVLTEPSAPPASEAAASATPTFSKNKTATTAEQRWQQLKAQVSAAIAENRDGDAIAGLENMLEIQPDNHDVRRHLAALLLKTGL